MLWVLIIIKLNITNNLKLKTMMTFSNPTIRINTPKTLRKYIVTGKYKEMLQQGFILSPGCGRFKKYECTCHKCISKKRLVLKEILLTFEESLILA